jgi:hypothetical protein
MVNLQELHLASGGGDTGGIGRRLGHISALDFVA